MTSTQRIVPSGKVYRQIFDAEVQLVRALEGKKSKDHDQTKQYSQDARTDEEATHIPVVHDSRHATNMSGMLTSRQNTWIEEFPNEGHIENPVLYKFFSEENQAQCREPESSVASKEVQGLPDVLSPAKKGSDIISRIAESRRQRHDAAVEDMHQQLGLISADMEPQIQAAGEELMSRLQQNDVKIQELMSQITDNQQLVPYTHEALEILWEDVAAEAVLRQAWIMELDETLQQLENNRIDQVREVFHTYADMLRKIAFLMPPDLSKLLDKESQSINQAVLSNRRDYADLFARLMMSDIERDKRLHTEWRNRMDDWKQLHTDIAVDWFRQYMESEEVTAPSNVNEVLAQMYDEQEQLNNKRLQLIESLRDLNPPTSTKTAVYEWNEKLTSISKCIDELNQKYFNKVYGEYEEVCQKCLGKVEDLKLDLVERRICTEEKVNEVIAEKCLPLVGERQSMFEKELETMDNDLEAHNIDTLSRLKSLFKFCQGAAHVWDVHELGLAKQERALQEKLDQCRLLHDTQNQDREANLDITMDRMRQDATEKALADSLKKALEMLEKIQTAYHQFHTDQLNIVNQYPDMVSSELKRHDATVCKFFEVNRKHPDDLEREAKDLEAQQQQEEAEAASKPKQKAKKQSKSRSSSRASGGDETFRESPLPLAVSEVLSTAKGTTFYVLTVAGEHGIPPEFDTSRVGTPQGEGGSPMPDGSSPIPSGAFMTETSQVGENKELMPYLKTVHVDPDLLLDIKKTIRMNFLDHLELWTEQSEDRASTVVTAKSEELHSELDLRLHLHEPRDRRAELDVHNVRAAELVMHSERVSRHCKGINQALTDLKHRFGQMTEEHNQLAIQFRDTIEALEIVFMEATKSSKLVSLSNQLQINQEKFMEKIRASLRQFRQHLDDTLQMLRESNARFIKSFKVFSDGGNFCPEEIDDYRKRLEKMSQKIDSSEGFIMADLEGMESKRLEQASKVAREFEDRFKHHMVDLVFMEKIARWLTNTQVKIKAEVADSNSQAQRLTQYLDDLDRRIDACEKPNLDKEQVTPTQLNDYAQSILQHYHERSTYLDCLKQPVRRPSTATLQGNPALGARVGFVSDNVPPISRAGKQPQEDPSVGVIKNILKTQKDRLRFGSEAELDGDGAPPTLQQQGSHSHLALQPQSSASNQNVGRDIKSRQSRHSDVETRSKKSSSKPGTASNSTSNERVGRANSGPHVTVTSTNRSKPGKIDKKFYIFGELHEEGEETNLLGRIRRILRESVDGLLAASELYYRVKGVRVVTRPQALQETFDECATVIVQKLQSYYKQADLYHNQCLQEFCRQLSRLEDLVAHVPGCVIRELLDDTISVAKQEHRDLDNLFDAKLNQWDNEKRENQTELRPALGHPQQADRLQILCHTEEQRRQAYLEGVEANTKEQQELSVKHGQEFITDLARMTEQLLLQFDQLLTMDDVNKGRVPAVKHATSELIRRKNAGRPLDQEEEVTKVTRGKNTWQGLPKNELVLPASQPPLDKQSSIAMTPAPTPTPTPSMTNRKRSKLALKKESTTTASVTTQMTTLGHTATVEARDQAFQEYKQYFERVLASIDETRVRHLVAEERWTDSWANSVNKIKALY